MRTWETIAPSPSEERCVQLTSTGEYIDAMRKEVHEFVLLLRKVFPWAEEHGVIITRKGFNHDFGTYYEAVAKFNDEDEEARRLAYFIIDNYPRKWTDETVVPMPETEE